MAHVWLLPAETLVYVPAVGVDRLFTLLPQHSAVPARSTQHAWLAPELTLSTTARGARN
jgi:hypothetical protein